MSTRKAKKLAEMSNKVEVTPGFCPNCGSILPPLKLSGGVTCFLCEKEFDATGEFDEISLLLH